MKDATDSQIIDFLRINCIFSVDVNTSNIDTKNWVYKNKELIKDGNE